MDVCQRLHLARGLENLIGISCGCRRYFIRGQLWVDWHVVVKLLLASLFIDQHLLCQKLPLVIVPVLSCEHRAGRLLDIHDAGVVLLASVAGDARRQVLLVLTGHGLASIGSRLSTLKLLFFTNYHISVVVLRGLLVLLLLL